MDKGVDLYHEEQGGGYRVLPFLDVHCCLKG